MAATCESIVRRRNAGFSLTDLCAALVIMLVLLTSIVATSASSRESSNRMKCASNLKQIGTAIRIYENMYNGAYPRTKYNMGSAQAPPVPTWGTPYEGRPSPQPNKAANPFGGPANDAPADNDVTAIAFLLIRESDLPSELFVCPASEQEKWDYNGARVEEWTNWPGTAALAKHLSYGIQNPYASAAAISAGFVWNSRGMTSEHAIASDMSPGSAALNVTLSSKFAAMRLANSVNHDGQGQNVLYGDGHADWNQTPFCGVNKDNIFTASGPELASRSNPTPTIVASPAENLDSVLLPTSELIGYTGSPLSPLVASQTRIVAVVGVLFLLAIIATAVTLFIVKSKRSQPTALP